LKIKAFRALRPAANKAHLVASVPYDTVSTEEALVLAGDNPLSFLRIVRPEIDLPPGADIYSDEVYAKAAENFESFKRERILEREPGPCLYVYSQKTGDHVQYGVVTCCRAADYENDIIKRHEKTRLRKENDRTRMLKTIRANAGPVFLAYRDNDAIDRLVADVVAGEPFCDFVAADMVRHTVWRVTEPGRLIAAFGDVPALYVADGHHRAAAAARIETEERESNPEHTGDEDYNWFLTVVFPAGHLRILAYNRYVSDLNGLEGAEFLDAVGSLFTVTGDVPPPPASAGTAGMYFDEKWYSLAWEAPEGGDPVSSLDVSVLQERLLGPVLGIGDPRQDRRIDFVGGIRGTEELEMLVDTGKAAVAFAMCPVSVEQVMAVADAGRIMPPKTTWFEPKLRSGLFVHTFQP